MMPAGEARSGHSSGTPHIARPPISLSKMLVEEHHSSVLYRCEYNPYFKTNVRLFPALEFLVQLLQHLPEPRTHLVRRYGLYSSRSRGTWSRKPWLVRLAPQGWAQQHAQQPPPPLREARELDAEPTVSSKESRSAWARLLAKIYDLDRLTCSRCGSPMKVLAVITDPPQVRRILLHLIKSGLAPPGLESSALS
jgi:hypothetical protein